MSAEEILKKLLLSCFFVKDNGSIEWSYQDNISVADIEGKEFEKELVRFLPLAKQKKYLDRNKTEPVNPKELA